MTNKESIIGIWSKMRLLLFFKENIQIKVKIDIDKIYKENRKINEKL